MPFANHIVGDADDGDGARGGLRRLDGRAAAGHEQVDLGLGELPRDGGHLLREPTEAARVGDEVLVGDESHVRQPVERAAGAEVLPRHGDQEAQAIDPAGLLRARGDRQSGRCPEIRNNLPPPHAPAPSPAGL